jgi:hypothetical protein
MSTADDYDDLELDEIGSLEDIDEDESDDVDSGDVESGDVELVDWDED